MIYNITAHRHCIVHTARLENQTIKKKKNPLLQQHNLLTNKLRRTSRWRFSVFSAHKICEFLDPTRNKIQLRQTSWNISRRKQFRLPFPYTERSISKRQDIYINGASLCPFEAFPRNVFIGDASACILLAIFALERELERSFRHAKNSHGANDHQSHDHTRGLSGRQQLRRTSSFLLLCSPSPHYFPLETIFLFQTRSPTAERFFIGNSMESREAFMNLTRSGFPDLFFSVR